MLGVLAALGSSRSPGSSSQDGERWHQLTGLRVDEAVYRTGTRDTSGKVGESIIGLKGTVSPD
jgi:hypothetical protein